MNLAKDTKLLRLVSARLDMGYSLEAFAVLKEIENADNSMFYHAALSMAVCYGRPFFETNGLGRLQVDYPAFPDFPDSEMNLRHSRLIDLRNKFMAHSSCEGTRVMIVPPGAENPLTGMPADQYEHLVGKRVFGDLRYYSWLSEVIIALKGRLDIDAKKRAGEIAGSIFAPTEMDTEYDSFQWSIPPSRITQNGG